MLLVIEWDKNPATVLVCYFHTLQALSSESWYRIDHQRTYAIINKKFTKDYIDYVIQAKWTRKCGLRGGVYPYILPRKQIAKGIASKQQPQLEHQINSLSSPLAVWDFRKSCKLTIFSNTKADFPQLRTPEHHTACGHDCCGT